jgi:hypothetical protein
MKFLTALPFLFHAGQGKDKPASIGGKRCGIFPSNVVIVAMVVETFVSMTPASRAL